MKTLSILRSAVVASVALGLAAFTSGSGSGAGAGKIVPDATGQHMPMAPGSAEPPDPCVTGGHTVMMRKAGGEQERTHEQARTCASRTLRPGTHMLNPQPLPPG